MARTKLQNIQKMNTWKLVGWLVGIGVVSLVLSAIIGILTIDFPSFLAGIN